jgi:16S rRNA (guanine527-N7)-methyltransferase
LDALLEEGLRRLCENDPAVNDRIGGRMEDVLRLLEKYTAEIELFNPAYGLVGAKDRRELTIKHVLDSLSPLGVILRRAASIREIADAGSGAGLPGIPLAIALPDSSFTLIERMGRRCGFLRNTVAVLGLSNVVVAEGEIERQDPGAFDIISFRAFRPLEPAILRALFALLKKDGILAAYKGRRNAIDAEMENAAKHAGPWEAIPCPVPFLDEERHLLIIKPPPVV